MMRVINLLQGSRKDLDDELYSVQLIVKSDLIQAVLLDRICAGIPSVEGTGPERKLLQCLANETMCP